MDGHDRIAGSVGVGNASWRTEPADPMRIEGEERPGELPRLTIDIAPAGEDLRP